MNLKEFRVAKAAELERLRKELQIAVGTDEITPDVARARMRAARRDLDAKEEELGRYVGS